MSAVLARAHKSFDIRQQRFADDLNAAFAGDESGRVYKYLYLDPVHSERVDHSGLAQTLDTADHYYVFKNGLWIVKNYADQWAELVGKGRPLIELGIGAGKALEKTKVLVQALQPSRLIINDYSVAYLDQGKRELSKSFPELHLGCQAGDFLGLTLSDFGQDAPIVFLQGCTLSNYDDMVGVLEHIAALAGPAADIFVDFDTNQDIENLNLAYGSAAQIKQRKQILEYANALFAPKGFDPRAFEWECEWRPDQNLLLQKLVSTKPQSFSLDGVCHIGVSNLAVSKMYKYPVNVFNGLVDQAGLDLRGLYRDYEGKVAMAHLKPKP